MKLFRRNQDEPARGQPAQSQRNPARQPMQAYSSLNNRRTGMPAGGQRERNPARDTPPAAQSRTFSYYANRSQTELNTGRESLADQPLPRRLPSRLRKLRTHAGMVAGGMIVLGAVLYQLQLSGTPDVVSLVPASDTPFLRDSKTYQDAAVKLFRSSPANRNKLTIDSSGIAARMQDQFPELQSVTVGLPLIGDTPTLYVRPADPALVLVTGSDSFVLDQRGRALSTVASASQLSRLKVPTVTDQSNLSFKLGDQALSRGVTSFIQTVARQHRAHQADIGAMVLPAGNSELDVYPAGQKYFVRYNTHTVDGEPEDAAALQAGTYQAVKRHLKAKNIVPSQYIDVRLQGRAYYK